MDTARKREVAWAVVRLILGTIQIAGATAGVVLLIGTGVSHETFAVVCVTGFFTVLSRILFQGRKASAPRRFHADASTFFSSWMILAKKLTGEFLGTFALVFAGTGAIVINDISGGAVSHVGIALTFGLVVLAMIYTFGDISGAHINPAVTVAFFAARRLPARTALFYVISQCAGAFAASFALRFLFPKHPTLGATIPAGPAMQSFVLEMILTALLMLVILSVSTGAREKGITAGIAVGAVIGLEAMFAGPVCGASMNPARSLAPALVSGNTAAVWIYLLAPVLGALVAVPACICVREQGCCTTKSNGLI
jgi:aquaporin NIP